MDDPTRYTQWILTLHRLDFTVPVPKVVHLLWPGTTISTKKKNSQGKVPIKHTHRCRDEIKSSSSIPESVLIYANTPKTLSLKFEADTISATRRAMHLKMKHLI